MLNVPKTYAQMGKISNNLEKHGEEDVTAFDIPIAGIDLTSEEINALLEDPYADRALFDANKGGEPTFRCFEPLRLKDSFEGATVIITIHDEPFTLADCRIRNVELELHNGRGALLSFQLRLRPENDKQIVQLIGHQNREIQIDVQDARVALKGGRKQRDMFADGANAGEAEAESEQAEGEELTHPEQLFEEPKKRRGRPRKNGEARAH